MKLLPLLALVVLSPGETAVGPAPALAPDTLSADTAVVLDPVHVVGTRTSPELAVQTRAVEVLDRSVLDGLPARNVADVLRWATGVELGDRSRAQADVSIRGAGFEQTLVLVDGVRMNDAQTGHFNLDLTIPLDRVERIEILRGAASAVYGADAVGGVIHIVTRQSPGWTARAAGGSFGTGELAATGGTSLEGLGLSGGATLEWGGEVSTSDGHRPGTDAEVRQGSVTFRSPLAGGRLVVDAGVGDRAFGARDFYAVFDSFEETRTSQVSASWRSAPGARVVLEPRLVWREHTDDFLLERDDPEGFRNVHTSSRVGGEVMARSELHPRLGLALGAGAWREELESTGLGDRVQDRREVLAEADLRATSTLRLNGGLRLDDHDVWGRVWSPSVAMSLDVRPDLRLRASAGRAFRGPTWTERFYSDPAHSAREELDPERSRVAEVGARLTNPGTVLPEGSFLDLAAFRRTSRDLIDWTRQAAEPDALWETRNVNRARVRGAELRLHLPAGDRTRLDLSGSVLSLEADAEAGLVSKYALRPPSQEVSLAVERLFPRGITAHVQAIRGRRPAGWGAEAEAFQAGEPARATTVQEVDARLAIPIPAFGASRDAVFHLDGRNLLGSDHPDLTGNPVAGRALYVGVRLRGG
ncbi:MAG: TonB-dependent receptor [Gemmatimonadales bacterium]|nr:MAG: TonB-dependent receptor [Gemmatimonadales bacterium]